MFPEPQPDRLRRNKLRWCRHVGLTMIVLLVGACAVALFVYAFMTFPWIAFIFAYVVLAITLILLGEDDDD